MFFFFHEVKNTKVPAVLSDTTVLDNTENLKQFEHCSKHTVVKSVLLTHHNTLMKAAVENIKSHQKQAASFVLFAKQLACLRGNQPRYKMSTHGLTVKYKCIIKLIYSYTNMNDYSLIK